MARSRACRRRTETAQACESADRRRPLLARLRSLLGGGDRRHRTGHPGAAETTIAVRVFRQVLLVIAFGKIERWCLADLGSDLAEPGGIEPALEDFPRRFGGGSLLRREGVDRGPVLRPNVVALA